MKTKVDILASYSQFFGEYDTVVIDEIIENDETRVEGISIRLTRRRNPRSLVYMGFFFPKEHNGILLQGGNGGLGANLNTNSAASYASEGYALLACNLGTSRGNISGFKNQSVIEDFGHEAVYDTHRIGNALYEFIYGEKPHYTYYWSGSTGGQMGMSMVLRHPECFDGVILGAPANDRLGVHNYFIWVYQRLRSKDSYHLPLFTKEECVAIHKIAIDFHKARGRMLSCDGETIAYPVTEEHEIDEFLNEVYKALPLSEEQRAALYDVYQGPRNENTGVRFYRGLPIGSEFYPHGLYPSLSSEAMLSYTFIQLWTLGHDFNPLTYDFGRDYEKCVELLSEDLDAKSPDICAYLSRGGKLLMYAGTADAVVPYGGTLDYVKAVRECVDEKYLDNFTFFVCPTIDHPIASGSPTLITCREDGGSVLDAIRAWVEEGKRPEAMYINAKTEAGKRVQIKVHRS